MRYIVYGSAFIFLKIGPDTFGFDVAYFILGMAGGFIRSIIHDKIGIRQGLINVIVGGIAANYFTGIFCKRFGFKEKEGFFAVALILGFFAVGIFAVLEKGEIWAKKNPQSIFAYLINGLNSLVKGGAVPPEPPQKQNDNDNPNAGNAST